MCEPCKHDCFNNDLQKAYDELMAKDKEIEALKAEEADSRNSYTAIKHDNSTLMGELEDMKLQLERFRRAVNSHCSCGGKGPLDPGVCDFCSMWHYVMQTEATKA